jgi:hypothetical protein
MKRTYQVIQESREGPPEDKESLNDQLTREQGKNRTEREGTTESAKSFLYFQPG